MSEMRIGICQLRSEIAGEDYDPRPDNLERATEAIASVAAQGAELVVFGEIYLNGYESGKFTPRYAVAERADDPFVEPLIAAAREYGVYVIMGATTRKGPFPGDVFNSALVIGPEGLVGVYNKAHVAAFRVDDERVAAEKAWWSPGFDLPVFDTALGRIGIEICYDVWFPEVARTLTLKGAELIVNVSASVSGFEESWDHMLYVRSRENAVPYLHVSVVGTQRDFHMVGWSRLFSPLGDVLAELPHDEEAVTTVSLDRELLYAARGALHPFHNRNPAIYAEIARPRGAPPGPVDSVPAPALAEG